MDIGPREILILAIVVLVMFGSKRIPDLAKGIADTVRQFRGAFKDDDSPTSTK
jgi:sec-independent protein translocase protein TatA